MLSYIGQVYFDSQSYHDRRRNEKVVVSRNREPQTVHSQINSRGITTFSGVYGGTSRKMGGNNALLIPRETSQSTENSLFGFRGRKS